MTWAPGSAAGFGTIDGGGQNREHERITRAALACPGGTGSTELFRAGSVDQLAGHDREFGGVGAPDSDEICGLPAAHCDDADFLQAGYPRTRDQATATLVDCVDHLRGRFGEAVDARRACSTTRAGSTRAEVDLDAECRVFEAAEQRAKCAVAGGVRPRSCTGCRTSTRTATGPTRRIRPARSGPTTRRVWTAGAEPGARPARQRHAPTVPERPHDRVLRAAGRGPRRRRVRTDESPMPPSTRTTG